MPDFRLIIDIKDVTLGDVEGLAQDIHDVHGAGFDAPLGDFEISLREVVRDGDVFVIDWEPKS